MYSIGDLIVYPMHGAGVIEAIEVKEVLGVLRKYYIMKLPLDDMMVMIPLDSAEDIGIRRVVLPKIIKEVITALAEDETTGSQNWNRRYRANIDKIKTGNIFEVTEVVRNLILRDREKSLSTGERKILNNAKQVLLSEIILVSGILEEDAKKLVEDAVKGELLKG
ncbi:MAG: CarD family transcriptional regulator [Alkaliphilus sp.]|nr:CarD family transcriptional regulator [bacterium AH-315-L21]PHS33202.1 MAG: CarD family transcriptional regulator [Alkaliphilus sp.]